MASRREQLEQMLADEPDDIFLRYGLAAELLKDDDPEPGLSMLSDLMNEQPPYLPAFFMSAQKQAELGEIERARSTLRAGIEQARSEGDAHIAAEMSELLANLGDNAM